MNLFGVVWAVLGIGCTPETRPTLAASEGTAPEADADVAAMISLKPPLADRELRGVWVTRWSFGSAADVDAILDDCVRAGLTDVFLQVRGRFDALYASPYEPWAAELSGSLGKDPGWDPLAYAIGAAHARGLRLHAWVNVYALWQGAKPPRSVGIPHALQEHRDWLVLDRAGRSTQDADFAYQFASPGNPEVRAHVVRVLSDLATRYAVDGLHLDYVRYPGREFGFDLPSQGRADGAVDFDEWRRSQIRETVAELRVGVGVPVTAAVWGIYQDAWRWGVSGGYDAYFQDSHGMLDEGSLDAIAPMIYWPVRPGARLDFETLARDHVLRAGVHPVWTGVEADKLSWPDVEACIRASRASRAGGYVLFEYKALRDKRWLDALADLNQ